MKARRMILAFALIVLFAQTRAEMTRAQGLSPAASVSEMLPPTERLVLPASQEIAFAFRSALSSQKSKLGDVVEFVVVRDIKVDGLTVIPAGSIGRGKITATKGRGHMGKPGRLEVEFTEVPSVNGTPIRLTGKSQVSGEDRRKQVTNDAGSAAIQMLGFGSMLIPVVLLERGGSAELEAGTRFDAAVAEDVQLERASIEQNQPKVSSDNATVFIIHGDNLTCGSLLLIPQSHWNHVIRMEIPEGRYWFHAGVPKNTAREISTGLLYGLTFGGIDAMDHFSARKILKRPVDEFFSIEVKRGQTYYISGIFPPDHRVTANIRSTGVEDGEEALELSDNQFFYLRDLSPKFVHLLQAEPKGIQKRKE